MTQMVAVYSNGFEQIRLCYFDEDNINAFIDDFPDSVYFFINIDQEM